MNKRLLLLLLAPAVLACGSNADSTTERETYTLASDEPPRLNSDSAAASNLSAVARQPQVDTSITNIGTGPTGGAIAVGAKLIEGSDCTTCHRANAEQLIGPGYLSVAQKYAATPENVQMLAGRVIKGGQGHWGNIAMTPHPNLSEQDAQTMVRYILSLK